MIRILGIDPGFASIGLARLAATDDGQIRAEAAAVVNTTKASKKQRVALRVSADDVRRSRKIWDGMHLLTEGVQAVAYEVYAPFEGRSKNGAKTAFACGLAVALGFALDVPVIPVLPADIKRALTGGASASKERVCEELEERVIGLAEQLARIRKTQRNHASDAAGIALVGIEEIRHWRSVACAS